MIHIIGIGVGGKRSLSGDALKIIGKAGMLVGGIRHLGEFPDSRAKKVAITGSLDDVSLSIEGHLKEGGRKSVAVLATGDPLLYGIAGYIIKKFGKKRVTVIPNVSTVQEAFSRIKESLNGVKVISAHGKIADFASLAVDIRNNDRVAIFTDPGNSPSRIASELLERGVDVRRAFVCESLGTGKEKVTECTLKALSRKKTFDPLNILILIKDKDEAENHIRLGIPDEMFSHSSGMITKEELRVVSLSKLAPDKDSTVWDIGACSGSVAIEAARIAYCGRVFAVEKDRKRISDIRKNKSRFGAANLEVVAGAAPGCLKNLPVPDAVFVGGGGGAIPEILQAVSRRIKKGGRVVVNAVTIETAGAAFDFFKKSGWEKEMVLISLSKTKSVGELNMLAANNPVFIIKGIRP